MFFWIATGIFIVSFGLIISERLDKTKVALIGAGLVMALGLPEDLPCLAEMAPGHVGVAAEAPPHDQLLLPVVVETAVHDELARLGGHLSEDQRLGPDPQPVLVLDPLLGVAGHVGVVTPVHQIEEAREDQVVPEGLGEDPGRLLHLRRGFGAEGGERQGDLPGA